MTPVATTLGRKLVREGIVAPEEMAQVEEASRGGGVSLAQALRDRQLVDSPTLARLLAEIYRCELVERLEGEPDRKAMATFGLDRCSSLKIAAMADGRVVVGDPAGAGEALDEMLALAGKDARLCVAPIVEIEEAIRRAGAGEGGGAAAAARAPAEAEGDARPLLRTLIDSAVARRATDIHLEPKPDKSAEVRIRIDGVLAPAGTRLSREERDALVNLVLVEAGMSLEAQGATCQDGAMRWRTAGGVAVDIRVSQLPVLHGVSLVLRLLYRDERLEELEDLGYGEDEIREIEAMISAPHGLVVVSGPTGSGKSTTLYAVLRRLRRPDRKIVTVEDPVEVEVPGVEQAPLGADGDYARIVRQFLRHDPDVMLVGEIRDRDTARAAVAASMTGHLVLTTVHANDGPSTISRLMDLGLSRWDVVSNLVGVVSQRLLRPLCPRCKKGRSLDKAGLHPAVERILRRKGVEEVMVPGPGCNRCRGGYSGRRVVAEVMPLTPAAREVLGGKESLSLRRNLVRRAGFKPLAEKAADLLASGETSAEEVQRVINLLDWARGEEGT